MDEILTLQQRVAIALEVGESHFREFKSGLEGHPDRKRPRNPKEVCVDIAETLVAFANADGGELLVGVEDNGSVSGLAYSEEIIKGLLDAPKTHVHSETPLPTGRATSVTFEGKIILYFSIAKGTSLVYLTADGRCLQRKDRASVPISSESIAFSRTEVISREYDREFIENAKLSDLQYNLVKEVADQISRGMSVEKCLQHLNLAEYDGSRLRIRRAALLLFGKEPLRWHPRLEVRVLKIDGTEIRSGENYNVAEDPPVSGNILNIIELSWDALRPHLTETRFARDAIFRRQIIYPELACREALVNAIAHRDYSLEGRGIEVHVYSDRLSFISPGGLLSSVRLADLQNLTGVHQSRNSLIARALREAGYMRELGEGIRRIYELMQSNDLQPPDIESDHNSFRITLHQKYVYSREQKLWLDSFQELDLTRDEKTIVLLGYNNHVISTSEIWDAVGIVDTEYYRQLIESLRRKGVLKTNLTQGQITSIANRQGTSRKKVPRFIIELPSKRPAAPPTTTEAKPPAASLGMTRAPLLDKYEYARVFVANLPPDISEQELAAFFSSIGFVADCVIMHDLASGTSKGYGFVEFVTKGPAKAAVAKSGELVLGERRLVIKPAKRRSTQGRRPAYKTRVD